MGNDTQALTLSDFLLARIAEDEEGARACAHRHWRSWVEGRDGFGGDSGLFLNTTRTDGVAEWDVYGWPQHATMDHAARHDPTRVLAECEAKRKVLLLAKAVHADIEHLAPAAFTVVALKRFEQALALPYADHPDYREEWKP